MKQIVGWNKTNQDELPIGPSPEEVDLQHLPTLNRRADLARMHEDRKNLFHRAAQLEKYIIQGGLTNTEREKAEQELVTISIKLRILG